MAETYNSEDRTSWVTAPSYVRLRHRYRGPRESWKLNAEVQAFAYDVTKLYENYTEIDVQNERFLDRLVDGCEVPAQFYDPDYSAATPISSNVILSGTEEASLRLNTLLNRIRRLEGRI